MSKTVIVIGAKGRFGRHAVNEFHEKGWNVVAFARNWDKKLFPSNVHIVEGDAFDQNSLITACSDADVIVNALNPAYENWTVELPKLTESVIAAAISSGATVMIPGNIYNYGIGGGINATLNLYRCDPTGKLAQQNSHTLSGLPLIHDFCLAGEYLVFLVAPVRANIPAVAMGLKSYSEALEWQPDLGTEILIFERDTLSLVSRGKTDPWFQWHFANGYVNQDGNIVTEFVRYEDFATNQYLQEVATGLTSTTAPGTLWSLVINPQTAQVVNNQQIVDNCVEFPLVSSDKVGQEWRYTYFNVHRSGVVHGAELFNAIARYDRQTGKMAIADLGENFYPSEPILVPGKDNSPQGWLLTVVYDGNTDSSEVRIYQSDALEAGSICRLALPSVIPPSFHGTWKAG